MARGKNTFSLAAGFNITGQQPIDSRLVVDNVADLYLADTWSGVGLYNGLVVAIKSTGSLYVLKNRDAFDQTSSWVAVGGDVSADLSALTARVGVVETKITPAADSGLEVKNNALAVKIDASTDNALKVTEAGLKVVAPVYDLQAVETPDAAYASQYVFSKDGSAVTTINIPKDQFLKSADYNADEDKLVFVFNTFVDGVYTEKTVDVSVKDLVDTYAGSDYIEVSNNVVSVKYDALKTTLAADLKGEFGIEAMSSVISSHDSDLTTIKGQLNDEGGLVATVGGHTAKITAIEGSVGSLETTVGNHTTDINGLKATVADCKVRNVNTDAAYGIALTHTDAQGEDGVNDTVGISVNIDTLAAEIIAKHEIPAPDASTIKLTADVGSNTVEGGATVQSTLENLDSRIKAAVSGGVTGIAAGAGISVNSTDVNNPTVSVVAADLIAADSALVVTDNKIDIVWSQL